LESLTLIYGISLQENILTLEMQHKLRDYLQHVLEVVIRTQNETGYWKLDWFTFITSYKYPFDKPHVWTPTDNQESRLLATSHLIEWMLGLPEDFKISDSTLVRGECGY
jgi:hypothetical protein